MSDEFVLAPVTCWRKSCWKPAFWRASYPDGTVRWLCEDHSRGPLGHWKLEPANERNIQVVTV